ncbi:MAG TPA: FtsW/RodA/SpoVE family cell cycle protein [Anaerolineales bacterium]|nr:FtsW/RodA/SpoVE family cell cycle protein [Anaerolineales bacterium]
MNRVIQGNLLKLAAAFLFLQTLIITLSPAVRFRTWGVDLRWSQWIAFLLWGLFVLRAHRSIINLLPDADPYLFPAAAFLSGWGLLTIWRLDTVDANWGQVFGPRQALWLGVSIVVLVVGLGFPATLNFIRKYKYLLLSSGLLLTALTLAFGTNPGGIGPRLWLGCCGIFFQPSEPLKLLLVAYLAAYLADKLPINLRAFPLIYPTFLLSGIAILLLLFQRDLGTASIFVVLYTIMIYLATGRRRIVLISAAALVLMGFAGYYLIDIIRVRIDSWFNPWADPSGTSYQIIQSILAIANGGPEGRGPGLGSPALVPVAISDFIFAAIAEETGLIGTIGLLAIFGIILIRGLRTALCASDSFRRLLAAGVTAYFGVQSLLIIGGNLRLLPLTGVTLPFISYGGSSLLTSFIGLLILLLISNHMDEEPAPLPRPQPYFALGVFLSLGLLASALANSWWAVVRGPDLLTRTDNPRRIIEDRYVPRGILLDRTNTQINGTEGETSTYTRVYSYPDLAPVVGYNHPIYGQSGLEASLDEYLRGLRGNPTITIWWDHLLYGMAPKGLDVRLSLDLYLQQRADEMMADQRGAVVLLNAQTGEIYVMSSHPTFDPRRLDEIGARLNKDPGKPLINRATQGLYAVGTMTEPFEQALHDNKTLTSDELQSVYDTFSFNHAPLLRMQVAEPTNEPDGNDLHISPLQAALASAALSNHGTIPTPRIAMAVNTPNAGWISLPALGTPFEALQAEAADETAQSLKVDGQNYWAHTGYAEGDESPVTWFIAGTLPNWQAAPLVVVVSLEENDAQLARRIGEELLVDAMSP